MTQPPVEPPPPPPPPTSPGYGSAPYQPPQPPGGSGGSAVLRRVLRLGISIIVVVVIGVVVRALVDRNNEANRDEDGNINSEQDVSVFELKQGDCLDDSTLAALGAEETSVVEGVNAIPCDEAHTLEAYYVFDLEDADDYPGTPEVEALAEKGCLDSFSGFVGIAVAKSTLEFFYLYPQQEAWDQLDDRSVVCLVGEPGAASTTGSLEGAKR